jgi:signal transduction histidine kinase/CheY-like chemotaxis protein
MKTLSILLLITLFSTLLNASTYKSIRVGSFSTKSNAEHALVKLKAFIKTQDKILKYQKDMPFRAKVVKVGKYYMNVVEPFYKNEAILQEVVDIIRTKYSYAYVRKIKDLKKEKKEVKKEIVKKVEPQVTIAQKVETKKIVATKEEKEQKKKLDEVIKDVNLIVTEVANSVVKNGTQPKDNETIEEKKTTELNKTVELVKATVDTNKVEENQTLKNDTTSVEPTEDVVVVQEKKTPKTIEEVVTIDEEPTTSLVQEGYTPEYKASETIHDEMIWKMLFFISVVVILLMLIKIYLGKKNIIKQIDSNIIADAKIQETKEQKLSKDKFISHISHELRTPMTSILGLTHLVLEDGLTHSQRENIQKIESSGQHMLSILNDILDASKIEAGEFKVQNNEFNINDTVEYVLNIMSIQAKNNNNEITIAVSKDVPSVLIGDSLRLGQILINIISNAIKYTKDGTISVSINKISSNGNIVTLAFEINDSGVGMSATEIENVFRPYTQTTSANNSELTGTGLGLSISKQLIEKMGGEINVTSKLGKGTTFSFNINFKVQDIKNRRKYRLPSSKFLNKSILIIDQESDESKVLVESLSYFKYKIKTVARLTPENFNQHCDIVMIKSSMLTSDVVNDLVIIKSLNEKVKIVVIDELEKDFDESITESMEIDAYLKKPYSKQTILNLVIDLYVSKKVDKQHRNKEAKEKLSQFAGKKILVAEDNEVNHKVIAGFLAGTGIELEFVGDGKLAFEAYKKNPNIDLILMDINMPMMNGYEATQEIRIVENGKKTPILALTADVMDDAILKALSSGMQGYISKPIVVDKFYKTIFDFLDVEKENLATPVEKEEEPVEKESDKITELSVSAGIKRCADDESFYNSMLEEFKNDFASSAQKIEKLCEEGDFAQAKKVSEEVRDFAVNIGAYNLVEGLETLEYELEKAEKGNWKKLVVFYSNLLEKLLKDIEKQVK